MMSLAMMGARGRWVDIKGGEEAGREEVINMGMVEIVTDMIMARGRGSPVRTRMKGCRGMM